MTDHSHEAPTPEAVVDVLTLGALEQIQARVPALVATLAQVAPVGGAPVPEDRVRCEGIAASLAMCLLALETRLSPEDLHRVHQRAEDNAEELSQDLSTNLWWYYFAIRPETGAERLRALSREFRARCYDLDPDRWEDPPDYLPLASQLVPKGSAAFAIDVGRSLRPSE